MSNKNELFDDIEDGLNEDESDMVLDIDDELNIEDAPIDIPEMDVDSVDETDEIEIEIEIETEIDSEDESKKESKHKEVGKHALKYDSIFKGKKDDGNLDEYIIESASKNNSFDPDTSSSYSFERESPTEYVRLKQLKNDLYEIIITDIKLNIKNSRRKPSRVDFNKYYSILVDKLDMGIFSYSEVFIEFAYYFSDNIENMFKLLDKKWGGKIAQELAKRGNIRGAKNLEDIDFL
jgi:hypothetical protein